jgi:acetyl esterase/lipase
MPSRPVVTALWEESEIQFKAGEFKPYMEFYPAETQRRAGAVLVCPGGAYSHRAPHEGADVAAALNKRGFSAAVLQYRVKPSVYPAPQNDVARAMRLMRYHAKEWNIMPDKVAVCGFSAGGHLAACAGTMFSDKTALCEDHIDEIADRPDALILGYPVLSSGKFANTGSFQNLLGSANPDPKLLKKLSLEKRVTPDTPPTFIFFTDADPAVPVENGLLFAQALRKNGVRFEMHIWPGDRHGLGLAPAFPRVAGWFGECCSWLNDMGWSD